MFVGVHIDTVCKLAIIPAFGTLAKIEVIVRLNSLKVVYLKTVLPFTVKGLLFATLVIEAVPSAA